MRLSVVSATYFTIFSGYRCAVPTSNFDAKCTDKMNIRLSISIILLLIQVVSINAQKVEEQYAVLTRQWLEVSEKLKQYDGLSEFCQQNTFRTYTINILEHLHHFDSVMIDFLHEPTTALLIDAKEYEKTLKDIQEFETKFSNKAFLAYLRESCNTRNDLERHKEDLKKEVGMNSYDGQIVVLESGLNKFLKHIDKRIIAIEKHMHMIHPDRIGIQMALNFTEED